MAISAYSTTASSNTTMEGVSTGESVMTIPSINDLFRGMGASLRSAFNDLQWFEYGDGDGAATVAYASATTFTVAGVDVTGVYHIGRKVRAVGSSTGTIYGFITNSAFSTNTTVTVAWISGSLSNEAITVSLSQLTSTNDALPQTVVKTNAANTFTASQTIQSSDAGASEGPSLTLDRASASPAASDFLGSLNLSGRDSGAGTDVYAKIIAQIADATAASEDARLILQAAVAGTLATILTLGPGVQVGVAPTGGDKGAGTLNATTLYQAGVAVQPKISAAKLVHRANDGSNGGTSVADTWTKRTLTEDTDADGIVSVSSSVFTLGAGTYIIDFAGTFSGGSGDSDAALRIRNTSDSSTAGVSTNTGTMFAAAENGLVSGSCIVTIAGSKNFELQYYHTVAVSNVGLGSPINAGEDEIYAWVKILKIA